jgi:hypothetical protein
MTETAELRLTNGNGLWAEAISGNTIVASATEETIGSNSYQGALYIFEKPNRGWTSGLKPKARLTASDGQANDFLGTEIAFGDNTIAAIADSGAIYVFAKPKGGWVTTTQTAKLTAPSSGGAVFQSVAIDGGTILAGTPSFGPEQEYYGLAWLYYEPSGGWVNATESASIDPSNDQQFGFFGASVALGGNLTVIGASGEDLGSNSYVGAAFVIDDGIQLAELSPSDAQANEEMGWSVTTNGGTMAAGALYATIGSNTQQGAVYVFGP